MAYIYMPQKHGGHSINCVAWSSGALCKQVDVISRHDRWDGKFAEIRLTLTQKYLGLVPVKDLLTVNDTGPTKQQKVEILRVLLSHKLQRERKTSGQDMLKTRSVKRLDIPADNPRPLQKQAGPIVSHKAPQKFRQNTAGNSEAYAIDRFRDYASNKIGKRQAKQNAKRVTLIGSDVAEQHDNAVLNDLMRKV